MLVCVGAGGVGVSVCLSLSHCVCLWCVCNVCVRERKSHTDQQRGKVSMMLIYTEFIETSFGTKDEKLS